MINGEKLKNECIQWIRNWFEANGPECNAVIGISGGKDSTVAAGLLVEALGKERVFGVLMPNGIQSDLNDAKAVVDYLGIRNCVTNIDTIYYEFLEKVIWSTGSIANENIGFSEQTKINLPPRIRMTLLYAISQTMNGRVVNTCNLSEELVGYSTRWGDNVGDFSPLGSLLTDEVMAIGDALGLPYDLVHKVPSDGLCGKTDEDNLGFTYAQINEWARIGSCGDKEVNKKISEKVEKNSFKRTSLSLPTFFTSETYWREAAIEQK